jgi:site-specific recombinase XerD
MDRRTARLVTDWLAKHPSVNTQSAYRHDVEAFVRWCRATGRRPLAAGPADIDAYRDQCLADGVAAATVARRLSGIASFFRYAAERGAVPGDPVEGVGRPASADPADSPVLDGAELAGLIGSASGFGPKAAALVALLSLDGLKLGETLAMDIDDASLGRGRASVAVTRRGDRTEVPISATTAGLLRAYIGRRQTGPLFLGDSPAARHAAGQARLTRFGADFILKRAGAAAGIDKPVSATVLRRSYIAGAHLAGRAMADISRQVGHREVRETARFVRQERP